MQFLSYHYFLESEYIFLQSAGNICLLGFPQVAEYIQPATCALTQAHYVVRTCISQSAQLKRN